MRNWLAVPKKYIRIGRTFLKTCAVEELTYRAHFFSNILMSFFLLALAVLTVQLYFYRTPLVGGWSFSGVLVLLGVFQALQGSIDFFLQPNMSKLVQHIRQGTMDYVLTKPVDSMFYCSFRHLVLWRLVDVGSGFGLVGFGLWYGGIVPSLQQWVAFLFLFATAVMILYSLWLGMMVFSFWAVKVDNLSYLFQSLFETARVPMSVYRGFVLVVVLPIACLTTFPSAVLVQQLAWEQALGMVGLAIVLFGLARWLWRFALRHYTSASS